MYYSFFEWTKVLKRILLKQTHFVIKKKGGLFSGSQFIRKFASYKEEGTASIVRISQIVQWLPAPSILLEDFISKQKLVVTLRLHQSMSHPELSTRRTNTT